VSYLLLFFFLLCLITLLFFSSFCTQSELKSRAFFVHQDQSAKMKDLARRKDKGEQKDETPTYEILPSADETFFPGRRADVVPTHP
jgi:hypothetical protein